MINRLRVLSDKKKRLLGNFFSLSILQGANYLLPVIRISSVLRLEKESVHLKKNSSGEFIDRYNRQWT